MLMKERAPTGAGDGHNIRVGGGRGGGLVDGCVVNAVRFAVLQNFFAISIVPDQPHACQRKAAAKFGQIFGYIVGTATISIRLRGNRGQSVLRRPHVNHFDMIHQPVTTGEKATAIFWIKGVS